MTALSLIKRFTGGLTLGRPVSISDGDQAEDYACHYLKQHHCKIVERNYHCRRGEIDIIAQTCESLVFVEVKFRSSIDYGHAVEMVPPQKQRKIIRAAQQYLADRPHLANDPCRFDVFALEYNASNELQVNWLKNAFTTG